MLRTCSLYTVLESLVDSSREVLLPISRAELVPTLQTISFGILLVEL